MRRLPLAMLALLAAGLLLAPPTPAGHVRAAPTVTATLGTATGGTAWQVAVEWAVNCSVADATHSGELYLVDEGTGERIFLGGITAGSGTAIAAVERRASIRRVHPYVKAGCSRNGPHASGLVEATGPAVDVPALPPPPADAPASTWEPTTPLVRGGCVRSLVGTPRGDRMTGTRAGDVIRGAAGADVLSGGHGHDCLIGGDGADRLYGAAGRDRLTGGPGHDRLVPGAGRDAIDGGPGDDSISARDGQADRIRCGEGTDRVRVDAVDRIKDCEVVTRR